MSSITVAVSKYMAAPAATIYNILADYNHHHSHILPPLEMLDAYSQQQAEVRLGPGPKRTWK